MPREKVSDPSRRAQEASVITVDRRDAVEPIKTSGKPYRTTHYVKMDDAHTNQVVANYKQAFPGAEVIDEGFRLTIKIPEAQAIAHEKEAIDRALDRRKRAGVPVEGATMNTLNRVGVVSNDEILRAGGLPGEISE